MKIFKGNIISCDRHNSVYKYLIENHGRINFVGDSLPTEFAKHDVIDLGNKALLPSFADSHIHFSSWAFFNSNLDVKHVSDFKELGDCITDYIKRNKFDTVIGFGASAHSVKEERLVTREELDKINSKIPILLVKYDGHTCICNSALLSILPEEVSKARGYHKDTGEMNQEAYYLAVNYITNSVPPLKLMKNMLRGIDKLAGKGIGGIHAIEGIGFPKDIDVDSVRFLARGQRYPFQFRIFFQTLDIYKALKRKLPRIGGCFANALDGCFGSLDAALLEPYSNDSSNQGVLYYTDDHVRRFTVEANRAELQIEMHAIGDAAVKQAVEALEFALQDYPRKDHRHTIIHACLAREEDLEKCAKYEIGIAAQPVFLNMPLEPLEYIEKVLGDRAFKLYPFPKMLKSGLHISGGSDGPVTEPDPIQGIYSACNHYVPEFSISIQEALKMFTAEAAWMGFDEQDRGTLEQGKIADMLILNKNPLDIKREQIKELKPETLFLSGKEFKSDQSLLSMAWKGLWGKKKKI